MPRPVLVTGAGGFVGGHLLDHLLTLGTPVVGWYRPGSPPLQQRHKMEWTAIELLDREVVARAMADLQPQTVYHLAGAAHIGQSWQLTLQTYENNVLATHHLLRAVRTSAPAARVLVTCSGAIYKPLDRPLKETDPIAPSSPYATSKLAQEMLAVHAWQDDGMATLVARAFNHTGPGQDSSYVAAGIARQIARIEAGLQEPRLRLGNLEPKRDLTDVRDVIRAYIAMMRSARAGERYNVCSGRQLSIRALLDAFLAHARVPITVEQDPALFRPNDVPLLVGDHGRLTADTGWEPTIPIEQTVNDLLDYWRQEVRR